MLREKPETVLVVGGALTPSTWKDIVPAGTSPDSKPSKLTVRVSEDVDS